MLGNKDEQGNEYKLYPPPKFKTEYELLSALSKPVRSSE